MAHDAYRRGRLTQIVQRRIGRTRQRLDRRSTALWDASRRSSSACAPATTRVACPPYNGDLFAPDGSTAPQCSRPRSPDAALGPALVALGDRRRDPASASTSPDSRSGTSGTSTKGCCRCGSRSPTGRYRYDGQARPLRRRRRRTSADVEDGELLWLTDEGGRKGGGVYYTPGTARPPPRARRRRARLRAPPRRRSRAAAQSDPAAGGRKLFDFRVLDPACGSAHFLVAVVDELADQIAALPRRASRCPAVRASSTTCAPAPARPTASGSRTWRCSRRLVLSAASTASTFADGRGDREGLALAGLLRPRPLARLPRPQRPRSATR